MEKLTVAILFGGRSAEHEVSLQSAKNVIDSIDKTKYNTVLIGISREGRWFLNSGSIRLNNDGNPKAISLAEYSREVAVTPNGSGSRLIDLNGLKDLGTVDVIFPVLHGPYGEDGTVQGLAKLADVPCVGAGILGSAAGMDKEIMKRLLRDNNIPIGRFITVKDCDSTPAYNTVSEELGTVLFVKPANLGSSVGISRATNEAEFISAVNVAFEYDTKIIIEEEIKGREIECAVLGNREPNASVPGEIKPNTAFYSYEAKYIDDKGADLIIPAILPSDIVKKVQHYAVETFKALECRGLARVDFFVTGDGNVLVNEINTIPGFTRISMYPKLWKESGISYTELIDRLISLAIEDFNKQKKLKSGV